MKEKEKRIIGILILVTVILVAIFTIDIILYNKNGQELATFKGVIGNVNIGEIVKLEASTTLNFANSYEFKVVIKL